QINCRPGEFRGGHRAMREPHRVENKKISCLTQDRLYMPHTVFVLKRSGVMVHIGQIKHASDYSRRATILMPRLGTETVAAMRERSHQATVPYHHGTAKHCDEKGFKIIAGEKLCEVSRKSRGGKSRFYDLRIGRE